MSLKEHVLIISLFIWNPQSSLSPASGQEENRAVTEGIRVLGEFISRKQTNLSALTSIVEVKVETALVSEEKQGKSRLTEHSSFHFMLQNIVMINVFIICEHKQ
jgi:hypothetical protein